MISADYKNSLEQLQSSNSFKGLLVKYDPVKEFISMYQPRSSIDYGCARGNLVNQLKRDPEFKNCELLVLDNGSSETLASTTTHRLEENVYFGGGFNVVLDYFLQLPLVKLLVIDTNEKRVHFVCVPADRTRGYCWQFQRDSERGWVV